jgi:hypothetical protein
MMKHETLEKLAIAEQFAHNAQYAGVARQAIADGYSSIDALFSALLIDEGTTPPKNHKQKLDAVRALAPNLFASRAEQVGAGYSYMGGMEWDEVEAFYKEWLQSRYETFEMSASTVRSRVATTLSANTFVIRWLAEKNSEDWLELRSTVARLTYGYDDSEISEALSRAHDYLFSEAEAYGERMGRKLSTKMASTTNFCGTDIIAGDEVTRKIIEQDQGIAQHAAEVYVSFCRLMDDIRSKRAELILAEHPEMEKADAYDLATDFMLSMKAKYHGERLTDTGRSVARMIEHAMGRFVEPNSSDETTDSDA